MAFSKADRYEPEEQTVNDYCKAINHPARQRILKQLKRRGMMTVEEIKKDHPLSGATMSFHIKTLRECHFIHGAEGYPYTYYQINLEDIKRARKEINDFFDYLLVDESD